MIGKLDPEVLRANEIKMQKRGKIIGIVMMVGSVLLTVILGIVAYGSSIQRITWLRTSGTVTRSESNSDIINNEERYFYEYEYVVDGVTYTGNDSDKGRTVSNPPSEGTSITVYYDPSNPQKSLTDTNKSNPLSDFVTWSLCCGPIFFIFGAVFLFVSTRKSQITG
jgi:hypothetical protein